MAKRIGKRTLALPGRPGVLACASTVGGKEGAGPLKKGFDEAWRDKLRQMQVPIFSPNTKADWPLRFDDIVADAMEEGPLRGEPVPLSAGELDALRAFTPKGVPETVLPALVQFHRMNKPEDSDWVVLPVANFDAYFGTTTFGRKWLPALPETVIRRSESSYGVSRYMVLI